MKRIVTERDLRMPEFIDAVPDDLEFRDDGKLVRKDRWETGLRSIANIIGFNAREGFEISDVVDRLRDMAKEKFEQDLHFNGLAANEIWTDLKCLDTYAKWGRS